jgi:hypothetical protein
MMMMLRIDLLEIELAGKPTKPMRRSRAAIRTVVRLKHRSLWLAKQELARRARQFKNRR